MVNIFRRTRKLFQWLIFNEGVNKTDVPNDIGTVSWNATDSTLDLQVGEDVVQQIGQEQLIKVVNKTGSTIFNGQPVYSPSRLGNRPVVALAKGDSYDTSGVLGLATEDILDNEEGFVTSVGYVRQIKTNYSGWAAGDKLYVSTTEAGSLTNIEPDAPHYSDCIGSVCVLGPAGIGSILVNIDRHKSISQLSDFNGTPITTKGQLIHWKEDEKYWDATSGVFATDERGIRYIGDTTVWRDMIADLFGKQLSTPVGTINYDYDENAIVFSPSGVITNANDRIGGNLEVNHQFLVGSGVNFYPHIHMWIPVVSGVEQSVTFTARYRIQKNGEEKATAWTTITTTSGADSVFDLSEKQDGIYNQILKFDTITADIGISDTFQFQMTRTDATVGDVSACFFDIHGQIDSNGSEEPYEKTYD